MCCKDMVVYEQKEEGSECKYAFEGEGVQEIEVRRQCGVGVVSRCHGLERGDGDIFFSKFGVAKC